MSHHKKPANPNPGQVGPINVPHPGVDPSTQAPQGGSPSVHDPKKPQFVAPSFGQAAYFVTLEQAEDLLAVLVKDGAVSAGTEIWENGQDEGYSNVPPARAVRGVGPQCLCIRWHDDDGLPRYQSAGILYWRLLELRSANDRLGNPIPKFVSDASGISTAHFYKA